MTTCIVCGEPAEVEVPDGDYKFLPVCANHVYPAYRIRQYLAIEDFKYELRQTGLYRALYGLAENITQWLSRRK
jgi:hypothetical protein